MSSDRHGRGSSPAHEAEGVGSRGVERPPGVTQRLLRRCCRQVTDSNPLFVCPYVFQGSNICTHSYRGRSLRPTHRSPARCHFPVDSPGLLRLARTVNKTQVQAMAQGTVKWFSADKGYGFITPADGGKDLFVHRSEIKVSGFATLDEGEQVEYEVGQGQKGPCANNVHRLN